MDRLVISTQFFPVGNLASEQACQLGHGQVAHPDIAMHRDRKSVQSDGGRNQTCGNLVGLQLAARPGKRQRAGHQPLQTDGRTEGLVGNLHVGVLGLERLDGRFDNRGDGGRASKGIVRNGHFLRSGVFLCSRGKDCGDCENQQPRNRMYFLLHVSVSLLCCPYDRSLPSGNEKESVKKR